MHTIKHIADFHPQCRLFSIGINEVNTTAVNTAPWRPIATHQLHPLIFQFLFFFLSQMASNASPAPSGPATPFDPLNQTSTILFADGVTPIPFNTYFVSQVYIQATSLSILYGSQIGVCFMMLAVMLAMTPRVRFRRLPTLISVAALTVNLVRMVLLAVFFTTTWIDLYVIVSQDASVVPRSDFNLSAAATILSVPVTALILAALFVQAWSMVRLWSLVYKLPALALSLVLVLATLTFNMMTTVIQTRAILYADINQIADWVRQTYLGLITASICWFCFLFNVRLVMHMWTNRSILPSLKGLKAMDVLVITNGILMFVPGPSSFLPSLSRPVLTQHQPTTNPPGVMVC